MKTLSAVLLLALCLLPEPRPSHADSAAEWQIRVHAGEAERAASLVTFTAPGGLRGAATIEGDGVAPLPVQIDDAGRACFILPALARGSAKTFTLKKSPVAPAAVTAETVGEVLKLALGGQPICDYQMAPSAVPEGVPPIFAHGAYLHPVFSPSGKMVTGDYPADHRWQRGIWLAWTKTIFEGRQPDFWNQGKGDGSDKSPAKLLAEVRFSKLETAWSGPVQAGFRSSHRFIDHGGSESKDVLHETWEVAAFRIGNVNAIDLKSTQTCAGATPLKLPKYHYGGLGVRGNQLWNAVDAVTMLTSNGDDRAKGDSTKARWVHLGGAVDGAPTGLAVLIHPANFRFPQPLRLNPKNPQICIAPSQDGDWSIEPGQPYVSRYRIVALDGPADAQVLDRLWQDYATPPSAEVIAGK